MYAEKTGSFTLMFLTGLYLKPRLLLPKEKLFTENMRLPGTKTIIAFSPQPLRIMASIFVTCSRYINKFSPIPPINNPRRHKRRIINIIYSITLHLLPWFVSHEPHFLNRFVRHEPRRRLVSRLFRMCVRLVYGK